MVGLGGADRSLLARCRGLRWHALVGSVVNKYKNRPMNVLGEHFRSEREYRRYKDLMLMQSAGEISGLTREVVFTLAPGCKIMGERALPPLMYWADFVYCMSDGSQIVEDCKGFRTPVYRIKRHLMKTVHGIEVLET
jgi:hypothetical protein